MKCIYIATCAVLLMGLTLLGGCGKKAPPFLPKEEFSLRVDGLKALGQGARVKLSGFVSQEGGRGGSVSLETCRVYHVRYPADDPPCDGCPMSFTTYEEIRPDISTDGRFRCTVRLKKVSGIHYFMVRLVALGGIIGPPSDTAKLIEE